MMYHGLRCSERITERVSEGKTVGRKASLGTKHGGDKKVTSLRKGCQCHRSSFLLNAIDAVEMNTHENAIQIYL